MPLIRLNKTDPPVAITQPDDMTLKLTGNDGTAYNYDWTGRGGLLPLWTVKEVISQATRGYMFRSIWIATDGINAGFFVAGDRVGLLSGRKTLRFPEIPLKTTIIRLGIASPYDRVGFAVGAKNDTYSIEILINTLDESDFAVAELPVNNQ